MVANIAEAYSIFQQPWWLDATAPGGWDEVRVEEGGKTVARLPFTISKILGMRFLGQPLLTQSLGPWLESRPGERPDRRLAREKDLFSKLISQLPRHDRFVQNFSPEVTNWLPFYWNGFTQTTRYTYVIDTSRPLAELRSGFSKSARKQLRKAESQLVVTEDGSVDTLLDLNRKTFERQGLTVPYPDSLVHRINEAARENGYRAVAVAVDSTSGVAHGASLTVGDSSRTYALLSGGDPSLRDSGAGYLLKWKSIEDAHALGVPFDLEGSMMENVEQVYRRLGAAQVPYFSIKNSNYAANVWTVCRSVTGKVYRQLPHDIKSLIRN